MLVTPISTIYTYKNAHFMLFTRIGYNKQDDRLVRLEWTNKVAQGGI